jgi:hypothetical protein
MTEVLCKRHIKIHVYCCDVQLITYVYQFQIKFSVDSITHVYILLTHHISEGEKLLQQVSYCHGNVRFKVVTTES